MITPLLRDTNGALVAAWREHFAGSEGVEISHGELFDLATDAVVSPANSFGYMDGGIDLLFLRRFGWSLQDRLWALLAERHGGELPVGQAAILETGDPAPRWMISAPTMPVPMDVSATANAYLALRAALLAARAHNDQAEMTIRRR